MKRDLITKIVFIALALLITNSASASEVQVDGAAKGVVGAEKPKVELVFVLDTTGSMSHLIQAAKDKIWSITNTIASAKPVPEIEIGIVAFRDRRDHYITKNYTLTPDLDSIYNQLMGFKAAGGGDTPESVNQALYEAVTKNIWDKDESTYKVIFLVGDSPPHMNYQDDVKYGETCKIAAEKGIIINTIQCGDRRDTTPYWQEIASLTQGEYFSVSQRGDYVSYKTTYDKEIAEKSKALDATRFYYGGEKVKKKAKAKIESEKKIYESAAPASVAQRGGFNIKASGQKNFLGNNELIDSVVSGEVTLEDVADDELPEEMQEMDAEERQNFIKDNNDKRERLKREISELSGKRQQSIQEQVKKEADGGKNSLDMKIFKSIKKQAEKKDLNYEMETPEY